MRTDASGPAPARSARAPRTLRSARAPRALGSARVPRARAVLLMAASMLGAATLATVTGNGAATGAPTSTKQSNAGRNSLPPKTKRTTTTVPRRKRTTTTVAKKRSTTVADASPTTEKPVANSLAASTTALIKPQGETTVPTTKAPSALSVRAGTAAGSKQVVFIPGAGKVLDLGPNEVAKLASGGRVEADVRGAAGLAATGTGTVILDVTVSTPAQAGKVTLYPVAPDYARTAVSGAVGFAAGATTVSRVAIPVGVSGLVRVETTAGPGGLSVSVVGWLTLPPPAGVTEPSGVTLDSCRILDTATGLGGLPGPVPTGKPFDLPATGVAKVPLVTSATPPALVLLAVGVNGATGPLDLTVLPTGGQTPALTMNAVPGPGMAAFYAVPVGADARTAFYVGANSAQLTVDVVGWLDRDGVAKPGGPC